MPAGGTEDEPWLTCGPRCAGAGAHFVVLLVVGLAVTQAALLVGVVISVAGFLTMVGGAAVLIRRRRA